MFCSLNHSVIGALFQAYATAVAAGVRGAQLEPALDALCVGLRRQLQIDEEILLPLLLQISAGRLWAGGQAALDRTLFEHVRADHEGCLALLDWLEQCLPTKDHPMQEPSCDAIVAVLEAYVMPHLREVVTVCPRLAAAGIDTLNLERQMAARRQHLDGLTGPPMR